MTLVEGVFTACFVGGCTAGAVLDVVIRRLPNLLCLALLAAGGGFAAWSSGWTGFGWHFALAFLVLFASMMIFRLRWIGGGDAKFFTALAMWFPLQRGPQLLFWVSVSGLALVLAWVGYRRARGLKVSRQSDSPHEQLPYGVAIALGALLAYWGE